ncbi:hypothetical protein BCY91_14320 [Pelobium manganitolerans]|uniref:Type IX secretion system membrane protein PorP/SprF n=1 Tax=Pelobium manganitolerans TaxID=1842495 RepID=A0A419SA19_9SPHI|nr:PorP/SprF family type IX secretion system membrane protein [Pelobium manganitolerans]RKD19047.1 hypothetical protein BCY91_14320 [Pelobium manganitolerans]
MKKLIFSLLLIGAIASSASAQLTPMKSQYFQNPYLVNPAMAGKDARTSVFANYANQWNKIEGSPVLMSFSASTPINDKASVGINIINDKAGLLARTQAMGTFAYRVPLDEENHNIRFGVSLSWRQDRFDVGTASGSGNADPALNKYNDKENYLDGNFGVSYQLKGFEAQFSYLNLNQNRSGRVSTVDYSTFYSSVSYLLPIDQLLSVKPLFAYRGIKGYKNMWDAAAEWKLAELAFYTMYHSNSSFTGGIGYDYRKSLNISVMYNSEPADIRGISGGIFDLAVGYKF